MNKVISLSAVVVVVLCYACAVGGQTTISFWHGYSERSDPLNSDIMLQWLSFL